MADHLPRDLPSSGGVLFLNMFNDSREVLYCRYGPANVHYGCSNRLSRSTTASCSTNSPRSAAAMPFLHGPDEFGAACQHLAHRVLDKLSGAFADLRSGL